jgi:hypothetical protein
MKSTAVKSYVTHDNSFEWLPLLVSRVHSWQHDNLHNRDNTVFALKNFKIQYTQKIIPVILVMDVSCFTRLISVTDLVHYPAQNICEHVSRVYRQLIGMKPYVWLGNYGMLPTAVVFDLFYCSHTPRCNFFSTFYPEVVGEYFKLYAVYNLYLK